MESDDLIILVTRLLHLGVLATFVLVVCSGCGPSLERTYSIEEQYDLSATRSVRMTDQLQFSIKLVLDHVPFEQDIFFTATFTNATGQPVVFRIPQQYGVIEADYPDTILLFRVEPINVSVPFKYALEGGGPDRLIWLPVKRDEFIMLPPHSRNETRLKLPRLVLRDGEIGNGISLPPGQYLVHMTYENRYIGYEVEREGETRYADVGAWVGKIESNVVSLTITP